MAVAGAVSAFLSVALSLSASCYFYCAAGTIYSSAVILYVSSCDFFVTDSTFVAHISSLYDTAYNIQVARRLLENIAQTKNK